MQTFNRVANLVFDPFLAPFGHGAAAFDLLLWPVVMGLLAILVYKAVSDQKALTRVKGQISMRLLEIRLFSHDIVQVLKSTGAILAKNVVYLGNHMRPMVVMLLPFVVILAQLVANYAYAPSPLGAVELFEVRLDPEAGVSPADVRLALPPGVSLDAPPVRTADHRVFWRLRADAPGDHVLAVEVGDRRFEKRWAVGGGPRKVPARRIRGLEAILYPAEEALPGGAPLLSMDLPVHPRSLGPLPAGELGVVLWALVLSIAAGFAMKGLFGVTL